MRNEIKHAGFLTTRAGAMLAIALVSACSGIKNTGSVDKVDKTWRDSNHIVALGDISHSKAPDNEHPVDISSQKVREALNAFEALDTGKGLFSLGEDTRRRVFMPKVANKLAGPISDALAQANQHQDIIIHAKSFRATSFSDAIGDTESLTARVFHRDGKLNIIIGQLFAKSGDQAKQSSSANPKASSAVSSAIDDPFARPGSRAHDNADGWRLVENRKVNLATTAGKKRNDWGYVSLSALSGERLSATKEKNDDRKPVARQRKQDGKAQRQNASQDNSARKSGTDSLDEQGAGVERSLKRLRELRDKDLITEEIYQEKMRDIVDDL